MVTIIHLLAVNTSGQVRTEHRGGREYFVADATLIVPGVLNGSQGALFYPPKHVRKHISDWDWQPLVVYHPEIDGVPVSAREPGVLRKQGVGFVVRNRWEAGKHRAEAWFDKARTRAVDLRVYRKLEANQSIELSTGLFTSNRPAPIGANYRGRSYDYVATRYKPDHLAVLPDQTGACSIKDGCGINVNTRGPDQQGCGDGG